MVKKSLRIAIFHLGFFYSGGGERLVLDEIDGLLKSGHRVTCFVPVLDKKSSFPDKIGNYPIKTLVPQLPRWFFDREAILILVSCVIIPFQFWRFLNFDLFIGANQPSPWYCWILSKLTGKPYVVYLAQPTRFLFPRKVDLEEGLRLKDGKSIFSVLTKLFKPVFQLADRKSILGSKLILTNGVYASQMINKAYKIKSTVCSAGTKIPAKINKENKKSFIINNKTISRPYVLLTNRHFPQKRFEYAISALPFLKKDIPGVSLVITGEKTSYTKFLEQVVSQLSLEDSVIFTGLVSEIDFARLNANAGCYVYTAPEEDFGMGIIEAMAYGVPTVAWDFGGPRFIITNNEDGYLAKSYRIDDLARKISHILSNSSLRKRMGRAARINARKNFSMEIHSRVLENSLFEVL